MFSTNSVLFFVFALSVLWFLRKSRKRKYNLPPGPTGLPLIGNAHQLLKNPHLKFSEWAKQYGNIYSINAAGKPAVVLNDVKTMREILGTMESTEKYQYELWQLLFGRDYGIANTAGYAWLEQHRFLIKVMKQFGFAGGSLLDTITLGEANELCKWIDKEISKNKQTNGIIIGRALLVATSNTIWNIVTGEHLKGSDSKLVCLLEDLMRAFVDGTNRGLVFMPWLKYIIPELSGYNKVVELTTRLTDYTQECIDKHQKHRSVTGGHASINDMIDAYLEHVENCTDPSNAFYGESGMKHTLWSVHTMLVAGSESTSNTLNWLIFYLVTNIQVQKKLQEEIDVVLGRNGDPSTLDRRRLPYLDAVVSEALRKSCLIAYGIPHTMLEDLKYKEFILPKGLLVIPNIYHANHDPAVWGDPENFRPERFLEGSEANRKVLKDSIATFQEGKRRCTGEQVAKDTMFLITAKLVQNYKFLPEKGRNSKEYTEPVVGLGLIPPIIGVIIEPRLFT